MDLLALALDPILQAFFPTFCLGCSAPGRTLCPGCTRDLCAGPLRAEPPGGLRPLAVWLGSYDGALRGLIRAAKFGQRDYQAARLAGILEEKLARRPGLLATADALVLPPVERDRRGYHPAWAAAMRLGDRFALPVLPDLLRRPPGLGRARHLAGRARAEHVARALLPGRPAPKGVRRVVLVDDLWTTGATARRIGAVLSRQGIEVVLWVFLARTPQRRRGAARIPSAGPLHLSRGEKSGADHRPREPLKIALPAPGFA